MTAKTAITILPDVTTPSFGRHVTGKPVCSNEDDAKRVRRVLRLELILATSEPERAVLRCAMNLLRGAEPFEIDPVTGVAHTVAGFEQAAASWVRQHAWYDRDEDADTNWYRHKFAMEGRGVQSRYAAVHPQLAEPVWFPNHSPRTCVFCLMEANEAAGLPVETGMDPVTGGVAKLRPAEAVAVALPGMENA